MRAAPGEQRERGWRDGRPRGSADGDALVGAGVVLVVGVGGCGCGCYSGSRERSLSLRVSGGCGEERAFTSVGASA